VSVQLAAQTGWLLELLFLGLSLGGFSPGLIPVGIVLLLVLFLVRLSVAAVVSIASATWPVQWVAN
jgi:hypothetical protein